LKKYQIKHIDWFKQRGFILGQDKANNTYYVVGAGTGRVDFGSIEQCRFFVENHIRNYLAQCRGETNE